MSQMPTINLCFLGLRTVRAVLRSTRDFIMSHTVSVLYDYQ